MTAANPNGESASHTCPVDEHLGEIVLIDQLPSDAWAEGVAIRPNGNALTSRLDEPELYAIDLNTARSGDQNGYDTVPPKLIHKFTNASSVFNLCALKGTTREEYAVISGYADLANLESATFHSFVLWRVVPAPDGSDEPTEVTKITDIKAGQFCMGMYAVSDTVLLIADAHSSCIWRVHLPTGTVTTLLEDPIMRPQDGEFFGVNRVKISAGYVWFTNTSTGTFSRAKTEFIDDGKDVKVTGPVEPIADGLANAEGLVMSEDSKQAYVVSYASGHLWRIDIDIEAGKGTVNTLREDLVSPTTMELVYPEDGGKPTLYIVCCGAVEESWLHGERGAWFDLAKVKHKLHITVTVTTEITYVYQPSDPISCCLRRVANVRSQIQLRIHLKDIHETYTHHLPDDSALFYSMGWNLDYHNLEFLLLHTPRSSEESESCHSHHTLSHTNTEASPPRKVIFDTKPQYSQSVSEYEEGSPRILFLSFFFHMLSSNKCRDHLRTPWLVPFGVDRDDPQRGEALVPSRLSMSRARTALDQAISSPLLSNNVGRNLSSLWESSAKLRVRSLGSGLGNRLTCDTSCRGKSSPRDYVHAMQVEFFLPFLS